MDIDTDDSAAGQEPLRPDRLLRVPEVADRLDLSVSSVRRLIQVGKLPSVKLNATVRVRERDLEKLIRAGLRRSGRQAGKGRKKAGPRAVRERVV